jgi:hypothetical protein
MFYDIKKSSCFARGEGLAQNKSQGEEYFVPLSIDI